MADTINTNSFFNQPEGGEGGGISSVQVLAQNAFDIATNIRTQFNSFVQTFDQYKLEAGESDRLISNTVSDLDIETDEINRTLEQFKKNFESLEDDIGGQDDKIKGLEITVDKITETVKKIQEDQKAAVEKAADDAFRAQDAAQKEKGGKTAAGLGGLASMMGASAKPDGGDPEDPEEPPKEKGLFGRLKDSAWGLGMGAAGLTSALWSGAGDKLGGFTDFMTGGLTDFDKKGRGRFDAFDPISGGKDKKWGAESKIDIDSDLNEFPVKEEKGGFLSNFFGKKKEKEESVETEVDDLESRIDALESGDPPPKDSKKTVTRREVKPHHFDMKTGKAYIDGEEVPIELYQEFQSMSSEEKLRDPRFSTGDPISPESGIDDSGLKPTSEKKGKGLFGGLFGKKDKSGSSGILGPISSDVNDMVNMDGAKVTGEKKGKGLFGGFFGGGKKKEEKSKLQQLTDAGYNITDHGFVGGERMITHTGPEHGRKVGGFLGIGGKGKLATKTRGQEGMMTRSGSGSDASLEDIIKDSRLEVPKRSFGNRLLGGIDAATGNLTDFDMKGGAVRGGGLIDAATGNFTDLDRKGGETFGVTRGVTGVADALTGNALDLDKKGDFGEGTKRAAGGFADFATGGMFDFDKKNRKGAPKDFGIRRVAGGVADWATMGATDFDKRGKGNFQFDPLFGGKDKAWGAADEQAKRGEKQSGMGIKRGIGGALDFATLGTFDFDKQNKKDAPKGWGIKRVAGGLADAITAGATDFDKRGTGIGQMKLGENMRRKKRKEKVLEARKNSSFTKNFERTKQNIINPFGNTEVGGLKQGDEGFEEALLNAKKNFQSVPSGSGSNFNQLSQPPEGDGIPEVLPIQMAAGDNTSSNIINQMAADKGDFSTDDDTADGTECTIACINMMKANSTRQILN